MNRFDQKWRHKMNILYENNYPFNSEDFDEIITSDNGKFFIVKLDNKYNIIDETGKFLLDTWLYNNQLYTIAHMFIDYYDIDKTGISKLAESYYPSKSYNKKSKLFESIKEDELINFATERFFNTWLDCNVSFDDLCEVLLDGFYGKDFEDSTWEYIYGYGKDYDYLEIAHNIGVKAASYPDIISFKQLYENKSIKRFLNRNRNFNRLRLSEAYYGGTQYDKGLRNPEIYGFVKNNIAPIIVNTLTDEGYNASIAKPSTSRLYSDVLINIRGGIKGIKTLNVNYYKPGSPTIGLAMNKFTNFNPKNTDIFYGLSFISDTKLYIIPRTVLHINWGNIMVNPLLTRDAYGNANQIVSCDVNKLINLAENEGCVFDLSPENTNKIKNDFIKYIS